MIFYDIRHMDVILLAIYITAFTFTIFVAITLKMLFSGGIYMHWRHSPCFWQQKGDKLSDFCDIATVNIDVPSLVSDACLSIALVGDNGKRSTVPFWKSGRTIETATLPRVVHEFYLETAVDVVRKKLGFDVFPTPLDLPTSCAVLVYDKDGDFINWHYDVNYFDGRFFTMIVPLTFDETCTSFAYMNDSKKEEKLDLPRGSAVLFEGERVFHMATKLCSGQTRVVLSMQFTTDPKMSGISNKIFHAIKDAVAF
jgi:hypothetical protein